jgi:putative tricarboxylic transport membrane protein
MSENTRSHQLIGRISALVLIVLAVAYGIGGSMIEYAFSSDPLGPRFVPVMLAILLGLLTLIYLKFPGSAEGFPTGSALVRVLAVPATLVVSVALMEPLGFAVSILLLTAVVGWIFGASPKLSLIGGVVHAALWWFIFSFLLEVYLPTGAIFG